jgi:tetratricopeptide (TPR) repeat protein
LYKPCLSVPLFAASEAFVVHLSPIEELRTRLTRVAHRRGVLSPSTVRVSQMLDHLLNEWYRSVPAACLTVERQGALHDRAEIVKRFDQANRRNDGAAMLALLPHVLSLPAGDPDRPQMLLCCGIMSAKEMTGPLPNLVWTALEEAAATAPPGSLVQLKALRNLANVYLRTGRFQAAYRLYRSLARDLHRFPADEMVQGSIYMGFSQAALWRGKRQLARRLMERCYHCTEFRQHWQQALDTGLFFFQATEVPLDDAKVIFRRLYPQNRWQAHLLGSYARALLHADHPRAALAVARHALGRMVREHKDVLSQAELYLILSSASHQLGQTAPAEAFLARAAQLLGDTRAIAWAARSGVFGGTASAAGR